MIAPLLPTIAQDLGMSLSATATLLVAMTLFAAGNLVAAFSSSFATLMVARIMMAIASGLYVPGANSLAGVIVSAEKRGRALAIVSGGMTTAIALGLPAIGVTIGGRLNDSFGSNQVVFWSLALGVIAAVSEIISIWLDRRYIRQA
ncbi:MFS transporter [Ochrobactrum soli]|uniref:MFS transporter, DHA1 family n=1 Tax=Ochrobactrum soli TaxID=2448455 RepID=A0A2P9HE08_9HYPH|nr:MFS transporter [[Ochrobactrum] soli]SPL62305.1 MFS transporter, DHA1 family [[Ochrobactrum] soli]